MNRPNFRVGDRVRSDDPWLKIDRPCTVTVVYDGQTRSLRPDGLTQDVPVPFDRRIAFAQTEEPIPSIAPDAMDRWHVANEAYNQRSPEELAASFITAISQDGKPWLRMVSQSWDAMAVAL